MTGLCAPRFHPGPRAATAPRALTALQVAAAYQFPAATGRGQTIALIELGGGYTPADLDLYFHGLDLPTPTVRVITVDGGSNQPGSDADTEVLLDIQIAGAVAPGAEIVVVFAPNTDRGFLDAVDAAIDLNPCAISISWGGPETSWPRTSMLALDRAFAKGQAAGIVVLAAAGDAGANDGTPKPVADFPASSPHVVACGGTRLTLTSTGAWQSERVWNDGASSAGGGGYSALFPRPDWQTGNSRLWRGIPDISGNADPVSGYRIIVDGQEMVVGGTSAVAPLMAGLVARLVELGGRPALPLPAAFYAWPNDFTDTILGGNNGWNAAVGWDPTSGLGSPVGSRLTPLFNGAGTGTAPPVTAGPDPDDVQFALDLATLIGAWKIKQGIV